MRETRSTKNQSSGSEAGGEAQHLREENQRLKDGLEGVLTILGDPQGYCENDRVEVEQAIEEVERALGRRPEPEWRRLHAPNVTLPEGASPRGTR